MNIVIIGTAYPYRGGLATFNERLAQQFALEGHNVRIETFTLQYPSFLFPGKTQYSTEKAPENLHIVRSVNSCNPFSWRQLGRKLQKEAPELIICCYWMAFMAPAYGTICRIAKRNRHTRCIALVHNMFPHEKGVLDKLFAPYFVHTQDAFLALSKAVIADIEQLDTTTPKTSSPHPIYDHFGARMTKEQACSELALDPQNNYLLFFGLVRAYKGLDLLIDALGLVRDKLPNLHLLIAGEFYEDEATYRKQIQANQLTERVVIRNEFIADADLPKYFGAADLIAQPYKSATQSGVTQVAFHFEKPMLVTNVGGLGEIVHHGKMGYAVSPNADAIAGALLDYFNNNRKQPFTEYVREEKKKYEWVNLTKAFDSLYRQTIR